MNHAIAPGSVPAPRGLEKEEPEQAYEDDIPSDDDNTAPAAEGEARRQKEKSE